MRQNKLDERICCGGKVLGTIEWERESGREMQVGRTWSGPAITRVETLLIALYHVNSPSARWTRSAFCRSGIGDAAHHDSEPRNKGVGVITPF